VPARLVSVSPGVEACVSNVLDVLKREGYIRGWFEPKNCGPDVQAEPVASS
jgi:ribosomal protein S8